MPGIQTTATVDPGVAKLGERVVYRGRIVSHGLARTLRWLPPESHADLTWGKQSARFGEGRASTRLSPSQPPPARPPDTLFVEVPLQVFRTGDVTIPGLRFQSQEPPHRIHRLPTVRLVVAPVLSPADSNADLRPLRGPVAAPWWERVPWIWIAAALVVLAAVILAIRWLRGRKRAPVPVETPALDPAAEALAQLAALRGLSLPAQGRFAEHAFHLSGILRRFLEATVHTPRPGDTTGELIAHLESTPIDREDLMRLGGLLRVWDRVKFARAPFTADEADRAERAVETIIRRSSPKPVQRVA